jgi:hypothetical protein
MASLWTSIFGWPPGSKVDTLGASEDRGVSQTFTATVKAGETRTVARSVVPTPGGHSICSLPRARLELELGVASGSGRQWAAR